MHGDKKNMCNQMLVHKISREGAICVQQAIDAIKFTNTFNQVLARVAPYVGPDGNIDAPAEVVRYVESMLPEISELAMNLDDRFEALRAFDDFIGIWRPVSALADRE